MRKYFLFILVSFFAAGFVFARPSFEIADHPWPDITDVNISQSPGLIIVTAKIEDISGIYSAGTIIKKETNTIGTHIMNDKAIPPDEVAGDHIYSVTINTANYNPSNYSLDIFAADVFGSRKDLINVQTFKIGQLTFTVPTSASQGSTITLSATLTNSIGAGVVNEPIVFEDITDVLIIDQANTDSSGMAQVFYNISPTASIGVHTLKTKCLNIPDFEEIVEIQIIAAIAQNCDSVEGNMICVDISTQPILESPGWKSPIVWDEMRYATYPDWTVRCDPDYWMERYGGSYPDYWEDHWNALDNDTETYATGYARSMSYGNYLYLYPTIQVASECEQISPDATGDYKYAGTYNNKPYYQRKDGAFFIFWDGSKWFVSADLGNSETIPHWEAYGLDSRRVLDLYEPDEGANGDLIVILGKAILVDKLRWYAGYNFEIRVDVLVKGGWYDGLWVQVTEQVIDPFEWFEFKLEWVYELGGPTFIQGIRINTKSEQTGGTATKVYEVQHYQIR